MKPRRARYNLLQHMFFGTDERAAAEHCAQAALATLVEARGSRFTASQTSWRTKQIASRAEHILLRRTLGVMTAVGMDLAPGDELVNAYLEDEARYQDECKRWRAESQRLSSREFMEALCRPSASRHSPAVEEALCNTEPHEELGRRAQRAQQYWLSSSNLIEVTAELVRYFGCRIPAPSRRLPSLGAPIEEPQRLIGDSPRFEAVEALNIEEGYLSGAEARSLVQQRLTLVEDLHHGSASRAAFERKSESLVHRNLIKQVAGILRRLKWRVYAGGAGLPGIYVLADLLAISGDQLLFVECLTGASIKFGQHERKRPLAIAAPMCLVGPVPVAFLKELPPLSYGIERPASAWMLGGELLPRFYRLDPQKAPGVQLLLRRGRKKTLVNVRGLNLRLDEDVAGLVANALEGARHRLGGYFALDRHQRRTFKFDGIPFRGELPNCPWAVLPFPLIGRPGSTAVLRFEDSEMLLKLGSKPCVGHVTGSDTALDQFVTLLRSQNLVVEVREEEATQRRAREAAW